MDLRPGERADLLVVENVIVDNLHSGFTSSGYLWFDVVNDIGQTLKIRVRRRGKDHQDELNKEVQQIKDLHITKKHVNFVVHPYKWSMGKQRGVMYWLMEIKEAS